MGFNWSAGLHHLHTHTETTVVIGKDVPLEDTELGQFTELRGSRLPDDHERDGKLWLVKFQKTPGSDPEPEEITTEGTVLVAKLCRGLPWRCCLLQHLSASFFAVCARLAVVGELSAPRKDKKCDMAFFCTLVVSALCKCL